MSTSRALSTLLTGLHICFASPGGVACFMLGLCVVAQTVAFVMVLSTTSSSVLLPVARPLLTAMLLRSSVELLTPGPVGAEQMKIERVLFVMRHWAAGIILPGFVLKMFHHAVSHTAACRSGLDGVTNRSRLISLSVVVLSLLLLVA